MLASVLPLDTSLDASTQIEVTLCATCIKDASTQPRRLDEALVEASMCLNKASSLIYTF